MAVVPAGVHAAGRARSPRHAALLDDRQRVHVGPEPDRRPLAAAAHDRHHAGLRDAGVDLVDPELAQPFGDEARRLDLLEAELGILVQVPPPGGYLVLPRRDAVDDRHDPRSWDSSRCPSFYSKPGRRAGPENAEPGLAARLPCRSPRSGVLAADLVVLAVVPLVHDVLRVGDVALLVELDGPEDGIEGVGVQRLGD